MTKEYGEKKGREVFYSFKSSGKVNSVDNSPEEPGTLPPTTQETASPVEDRAMKLPTLDQFRKQFRDAVGAGLPLKKCLDLGTTWGTGNKNQSWQARDAFRKSISDALKSGLSVDKAIKMSLDALPDDGVIAEATWSETKKDKPSYRVVADRQTFKDAVRVATASGKTFKDAIKHGISECNCGK
jgi:hypothetical protein